MLVYAWKQVWMWAKMTNEAMEVYSRVMMSTNGSWAELKSSQIMYKIT